MRVPKRDLIVGLQVHFEAKRLRIAEGLPGAEDLLKELMAMRARTSDRGHTSYSAPDLESRTQTKAPLLPWQHRHNRLIPLAPCPPLAPLRETLPPPP
jgi:hypothetical protein